MNPSQMPQSAQPQPGGFYTPEPAFDPAGPDEIIEWEASEYMQHSKGPGWFVLVGLATVVGVGLALFFSQWLFAALIAVMGVAFGIFGVRKPQVLHYRLSDSGLTISGKTHQFSEFRAFGVRADGAFYTIMLIPVKRLAPGLNIYFSESESEKILGILGTHLPMEEMQPDPIDMLMRKLRF